jgi:hypothetical protein
MSKRKKKRKGKPAPPTLKGDATLPSPDRAPSDVAASPSAAAPHSGIESQAPHARFPGLAGLASKWLPSIKTAREFLVAATAIAALMISIRSCGTAKESLTLSRDQAEANRRYHQEHVKADVRAVVRHSSLPQNTDNAMAAELVVWNNGPIKAVSLTAAYRVYIVDPANSHVYASMGISEPLVDYSFSIPELKTTDKYVKQLLSAGSAALYVVNLSYYRETDMEIIRAKITSSLSTMRSTTVSRLNYEPTTTSSWKAFF